jgi:hypothetical protein
MNLAIVCRAVSSQRADTTEGLEDAMVTIENTRTVGVFARAAAPAPARPLVRLTAEPTADR